MDNTLQHTEGHGFLVVSVSEAVKQEEDGCGDGVKSTPGNSAMVMPLPPILEVEEPLSEEEEMSAEECEEQIDKEIAAIMEVMEEATASPEDLQQREQEQEHQELQGNAEAHGDELHHCQPTTEAGLRNYTTRQCTTIQPYNYTKRMMMLLLTYIISFWQLSVYG